jgi:hypothetical protein
MRLPATGDRDREGDDDSVEPEFGVRILDIGMELVITPWPPLTGYHRRR